MIDEPLFAAALVTIARIRAEYLKAAVRTHLAERRLAQVHQEAGIARQELSVVQAELDALMKALRGKGRRR